MSEICAQDRKTVDKRQDVLRMNCLIDESGSVDTQPNMAWKSWKEYLEYLLNVKNALDGMVQREIVNVPKESITEMAVKRAIRQMKNGN